MGNNVAERKQFLKHLENHNALYRNHEQSRIKNAKETIEERLEREKNIPVEITECEGLLKEIEPQIDPDDFDIYKCDGGESMKNVFEYKREHKGTDLFDKNFDLHSGGDEYVTQKIIDVMERTKQLPKELEALEKENELFVDIWAELTNEVEQPARDESGASNAASARSISAIPSPSLDTAPPAGAPNLLRAVLPQKKKTMKHRDARVAPMFTCKNLKCLTATKTIDEKCQKPGTAFRPENGSKNYPFCHLPGTPTCMRRRLSPVDRLVSAEQAMTESCY